MKRNRGGERDLDHIILAAIRGLDRASLEYPQVRAGLILMMDRTFDGAPERDHRREGDPLALARRGRDRHRRARARRRALRLHASSRRWSRPRARPASASRSTSARRARPARGDRRGRRAPAARPDRPRDPRRRRPGTDAAAPRGGDVLEICPTSNLLTKALADEDAVRDTFRAFVEHGVAFTIATDGPEMMRTHLRDELELLCADRRADDEARARERARARGDLHARPTRPMLRRHRGSSQTPLHARHVALGRAHGRLRGLGDARPLRRLIDEERAVRAAPASSTSPTWARSRSAGRRPRLPAGRAVERPRPPHRPARRSTRCSPTSAAGSSTT